MRKILSLLAAALLLLSATSARAYINSAASVEWLATFCPIIVEAKVTAIDARTAKTFNTLTFISAKVTCDITRTCKGKISGPLTFDFGAYDDRAQLGAVGTSYLLFLDTDETTGKTIVKEYFNLDHPGTAFTPAVAYDKTGKILLSKQEILALLNDRLQRLDKTPLPDLRAFAPTAPRALYIDAPGQAAQSLWAGSATCLLVPPDPEFQATFLTRAQDELKRFAAAPRPLETSLFAECLAELLPITFYTNNQTAALLDAALHDTNAFQVRLGADPSTNTPAQQLTLYPLRQAAYEILKARGTRLDPPPAYSPLLHLHLQRPGGGPNLQFRPQDAPHDLYIESLKSESPPPADR